MVCVLIAAVALFNSAIQPHGIAPILVKDTLERPRPAAVEWNSFSRVRAEEEITDRPAMWGPSPHMSPMAVSERWMNIDGSAGSAMYRFGGALSDLDFLRYDVTNLAYGSGTKGVRQSSVWAAGVTCCRRTCSAFRM